MGCHGYATTPFFLCILFFREDLDRAFIYFLDCYGERFFLLICIDKRLVAVNELTSAFSGGHDD